MNYFEKMKHIEVIDYIRYSLYVINGLILFPWYSKMGQLTKLYTSGISPNPMLVTGLYYTYMLFPFVALLCIIYSLSLVKRMQKYRATVVSALPLLYLLVMYMMVQQLMAGAIAWGTEAIKKGVAKPGALFDLFS